MDPSRSGPFRRPLATTQQRFTLQSTASSQSFHSQDINGCNGETDALVRCLYEKIQRKVMSEVDNRINYVKEDLDGIKADFQSKSAEIDWTLDGLSNDRFLHATAIQELQGEARSLTTKVNEIIDKLEQEDARIEQVEEGNKNAFNYCATLETRVMVLEDAVATIRRRPNPPPGNANPQQPSSSANHGLLTRPGYARCEFCLKELTCKYVRQHQRESCKNSPTRLLNQTL